MAKGTRISIADQLASIAATSSRGHVEGLSRDDVVNEADAAAKPKPAERAAAPSHQKSRAEQPAASKDVVTSQRDRVVTRRRDNSTADGLKIRQRIEKPHVSLYAHPRVLKKLREIAVAEDCKPHDLYVQGLRLVLRSYGYDLDKLEAGEG